MNTDSRPFRSTLTPQRWQQLQDLFDRAFALDPRERSRFLIEECGDDVALREQALALLLSSSQDDQDLERRYEEAIAATFDAADAPAGTIIGRYRLQRLLGRGGMGTVYLAERADEQYQQTVAIKVVARGLLHTSAAGRFRSERQILARLNHPNIARLLDGGHTENGTPYLVMEYVEGQRIDQYCRDRKLSTAERLHLMQPLCAAVQYAHQNLIVHRDLKPSNILVTGDGVPKLLDFGIAKLIGPQANTELTRARDRVLTPEHASPEQLRGEPVGTASDIYNLGTLLYALLTERRPYETANRSAADLQRVICEEDPPAPSASVRAAAEELGPARSRALGRELAGDLDNMVLKAMHRDPARRYSSASALAQDIQNHLDGLPVQAQRDTWSYRTGKFVRRNKGAVASATMVLLLIAALTAFYTVRLSAERDYAAAEATKAKQVADFMRGIFRVASPRESQGRQITAVELLDRGAADIEARLKDQPDVLADLLFEIGNSYSSLAAYDRAGPALERVLALKQQAGRENTREYARALYVLANVRRLEGQFEAAEQHFRRALAIQRSLFAGPDEDTAATLTHLGTLYYEMKRLDDALELQREALPMTLAVFGERHAESADRMNNLALALEATGHHAEAEQYYRRAIPIQAEVLQPTHPDAINTKMSLGYLLVNTGRHAAAEEQIREVLALRREVLGNEHWRTALTLAQLGNLALLKGEFDAADRMLNEALATLSAKLGPDHWRTAEVIRRQGQLAFVRGDYLRAEELFRRAYDIQVKRFGETGEAAYRERTLIASALLRQGRLAEAEPLLLQSYSKLLADKTTVSPSQSRTLEEMAALRLVQNQLDESAALYQRAVENYQRIGGPTNPDAANALLGLARVALERGDPAEAAAICSRALQVMHGDVPDDHWRVALARALLGRSRLKLGQRDEAERLIPGAHRILSSMFAASDERVRIAQESLHELRSGR